MAERTKWDRVNRLAEISLNLANYIDAEGEKDLFTPIAEHLHLGYGALTSYLRDGVKALIDVQKDYHEAIFQRKLAEESEEDARRWLEECFGDKEIDCINDKDRARIMALCDEIRKEWDEDEQ